MKSTLLLCVGLLVGFGIAQERQERIAMRVTNVDVTNHLVRVQPFVAPTIDLLYDSPAATPQKGDVLRCRPHTDRQPDGLLIQKFECQKGDFEMSNLKWSF